MEPTSSLKNVQRLRIGHQHAQRGVILHPDSDLTRHGNLPVLRDVLMDRGEQQGTKWPSQAGEELERLRPLIRQRYRGRRQERRRVSTQGTKRLS